MASAGTAYVSIRGDFSALDKQVDNLGGGMKSKFAKFGRIAAAGVAAGATGFGILAKASITAASDINESLSKNQQLFGRYSKSVETFSNSSAKSFGISKKAALEYTGVFGNLFRSMGISEKASAGMSVKLTKLAADMASFNNSSPEEALEAIRSGLVGETEPLRRFGVNMNDATLKAQALKMGLIDNVKEALTPQNKALAASSLITKQTSQAHGDFARTSGGLANQTKILKARLEDASAALGMKLLPFAVKVATALNNLGPISQKVIGWFKSMFGGGGGGGLSSQVDSAKQTLATFVDSVKSTFQGVVDIATVLWARFGTTIISSVKSTVSNLAQILRGVFTIIKGVVDLVAGVLTGDWSRAWDGIKAIFSGVWTVIGGIVKQIWNVIATVVKAGVAILVAILGGLPGLFVDAIKAGVSALIDVGKWVLDTIIGGFKTVTGLLGTVGTWIKDRIVEFIKNSIEGWKIIGSWVLDRIVDGFKTVTGLLGTVGNWIKDRVTEFIKHSIAGWKIVGTWVLDRIVDGFKTVTGLLSTVGTWIKDRVTDFIHHSIEGWKIVGTWALNRIVDGFKTVTEALSSAGTWVKNRIVEFVTAAAEGFQTIGTRALNWIVDGFKTVTKALGTAGEWIKDRIVDLIKDVGKGFSNVGGWIVDKIVDGLKAGANKIVEFVNKIIKIIRSIPGVPDIPYVKAFAAGGVVSAQALAQGGKVTRPIVMMGEEAPRHPEYVIPTNPAYRGRARDLLGQAASKIGFKAGGIFESTSYGPPWGGIQGTGVTATGVDLRGNPRIFGVAVDPSVIGLGERISAVPNPFNHGGDFRAFDTGGAIKGNRLDFYDWRGRGAQNAWGRRNVRVGGAGPGSPGGGLGGLLPDIPNPMDLIGKLPGLGGLPDWLKGTGKYVLAKAAAYIKKKIGDIAGGLFDSDIGVDKLESLVRMAAAMNAIHAKGYPYVYGGGHGSFDGPYDCSGLVSAILHAGGLLGSPVTTDGLKVFGDSGDGKAVTIGVRGSTGASAHTMMKLGNKYLESGSGHGARWVNGWAGNFPIHRHPPGFHDGGWVKPPGGDKQMTANLLRGEYVLDPNTAAAVARDGGSRPIYADIYIGGEKIDERVEVKIRESDRVGAGVYRAGVSR